MDIVKSVTLGVVQGLTEFLPISSTAHLKIIPALLHWDDPGAAATAVIQLGTLLAVVVYFARDLWSALVGTLRGIRNPALRQTPEARMGFAVIVGTIPICIAGLAFKNIIVGPLRSLYVIAAAQIVGAIVLYLAEVFVSRKAERGMGDVQIRDGLNVGLAQVFALIPGVSRSGSTLTGAFLTGLNREAAARFSFLLSVPAVLLSGLFEMKEFIKPEAPVPGAPPIMHWTTPDLVIATVVSGLVGYASIAFLISYLRKRSTLVFVVYRLLLGLLLFYLLRQGILSANQ